MTPRTIAPVCEATRGTAQITGDRLTFAPNEGTWILLGTAASDGRATAERIQLGANKLPFETRLEGNWSPTSLTAVYTTPRCTFDVRLARH